MYYIQAQNRLDSICEEYRYCFALFINLNKQDILEEIRFDSKIDTLIILDESLEVE